MGDADGDGAVPEKDPEATIDGATPAPVHVSVRPDAPAGDYPELLAVERHHYVVEGEIATGGMGRVIAAHDRRLGRDVAIKELLPKNRDAVRRFEREARITARLQHPAIIHVYEAGTWAGGEPFYAMPKVAGRSLDKVVGERTTLNDRLGLIPNVIAVADALAYAHSQHVIHRDLKPSNVLVGDFGETVVIDWGLAKDLAGAADAGESLQIMSSPEQTSSGSVVGTPAYMPPEQARGAAVDERADVYALGALLYKVLVGRAPYTGDTGDSVIEQVKLAPPTAVAALEPGAPQDLIAIVAKAMARAPSERYANAGELAADLKRFQTGQLVAAHRYTSWQLVRRWVRRRLLVVTVATIALAVIAAVAAISVQRILAERARAETRRFKLLEERGRTELEAGHPGRALVYLAAAARYGVRDGVRGMLIADAMRPFEAEVAALDGGPLVAVSPDGKHIATGGLAVAVWSTTGVQERPLGKFARIRALAWDSAGKQLLAAGDDGKARVWGDGPEPKVFDHGSKRILDAAFDATGTRIATASEDGTAIVWSVETGQQLAVSTCHGDARVGSVRFSDGGDRVATASEDGKACVWSAATGKKIKVIENGTPIETLQWTHHDQWIVTASADGTAGVWSAELGSLVVAPLQADTDTIVRVAVVSHDGRYLVTAGGDRVARVWRLPAEAHTDGTLAPAVRVATLAGQAGEIVSAAFSDDDSMIATGGVDRNAIVWDRERGQALALFEHDDDVDSVAFAEGDTRLVTGSRNGEARIWKTPVDGRSREMFGGSLHALATAPDGTLAVGTENNSVSLVKDGNISVLRGHQGRVWAVAFTPDGKTLISGGDDSRPIVWDVATAQKLGELGEHQGAVHAIAVSPDGTRVATAAGDTVRVWQLDGKLVGEFQDKAATIGAVQFSPSGDYVEIGGDEGALIRWRPGTNSGTDLPAWKTLPGAITALAHSPADGALVVATASAVAIYPRAGGDYGNPVPLDGPGEVRGVAFTRDGSRVITAADGGAKIWDASSGKLLATRAANGRLLEALAVTDDDLWLCGKDGFLAKWSIHVDHSSIDALDTFVRCHDPWILGDADIIQLKGLHGQRGSDCK